MKPVHRPHWIVLNQMRLNFNGHFPSRFPRPVMKVPCHFLSKKESTMFTKPLTQLLQRHSLPMSGLLFFGIMAAGPIGAYATPDTSTLEEITTTATRMPQPLDQYGGNLSVLPHEHLELVSHTHTHESFAQIAGGWTTSTLLRGIKMRSCAL